MIVLRIYVPVYEEIIVEKIVVLLNCFVKLSYNTSSTERHTANYAVPEVEKSLVKKTS